MQLSSCHLKNPISAYKKGGNAEYFALNNGKPDNRVIFMVLCNSLLQQPQMGIGASSGRAEGFQFGERAVKLKGRWRPAFQDLHAPCDH